MLSYKNSLLSDGVVEINIIQITPSIVFGKIKSWFDLI